MPQLGILFDAQKLGSGFYGYTAFRILFTVAPPRELAGCILYHGEVGDGRQRPYCISIECDQASVLVKLRQAFQNSMARGLMPPGQRFLEGVALHEEVLALAARVTQSGQIADCTSRWLQEAWQRATNQSAMHATPAEEAIPVSPKMEPRQRAEARVVIRLPDRIPLALRSSQGGRRAFSWLIGFSIAGAAFPWFGPGLASCAMVCSAGLVYALTVQMRLWAESDLSDAGIMDEVLKLFSSKTLTDVAERLSTSAAQASPLLRRLAGGARLADATGAALVAGEHSRADWRAGSADVAEVRLYAAATFVAAMMSVAGIWVWRGAGPLLTEAPRLVFGGLSGGSILWLLAGWLQLRTERQEAALIRLTAQRWLTALGRATVSGHSKVSGDGGVEKAMHELAVEFQGLRSVLERRRDGEVAETLADLRSSIEQLTPVLAGFREPFVLQAVPVPAPVQRPKAMSATA